MALRNGLLVHGPTHWAAAVRSDSGEIQVASGPKPSLGGRAAERVPGVRGVLKLAEAMAVIPLVKRALPEARLPMQDARTLGAMGAAAFGGQLIRAAGARTVGREAAVAVVSLMPALMALRSGDLAAYHGVEHKAIAGYEDGSDAADQDKEHDRCGSHLVTPMLAAAAVGNVAARRAGLRGPAAEAAVGLGSAAVAVEVFAWSERHADSRVARAAAPARARDPARGGHARAHGRAARGGPAALAEILRAEGPAPPDAWPPRPAGAQRLAPEVFRLPVERIRDGLLHGRLLQPHEGAAGGARAAGRA